MNRKVGDNSSAPRRGGNQLISGILIGMVVGVSLAAVVAWLVKSSPSPYTQQDQTALVPPAATPKSAPLAPQSKSTANTTGDKPRFEFYKVLTDKQDEMAVVTPKPKVLGNQAVQEFEPQILQAGSFTNMGDAENLKAKLALLGVEADIQTATIPDKGVWYRVRLGPYKSADEIYSARNFLKLNGVESTQMRAQ